jgi:hypothetical protein
VAAVSKFLVGNELLEALYSAGVIGDDYTYIRRIVIDLEVGNAARIYIDRYADDEQLVAALTAGIRIVDTAEEAGRTTGMGLPKPGERGKTG